MSELFGLCANAAIKTSFTFDNANGKSRIDEASWGVGFYRNGEMDLPYAAIIKEPISARYSLFNYFLKYGYIKTDMFISNIRYASVGTKVYLNTHPFELMVDPRPDAYAEKWWVFTHNGTIPEIRSDPVFFSVIKPHGNTDSEYIFCYMIEQLRKAYMQNGFSLSVAEKIDIIENTARRISFSYPNNLNFIISDGSRMYAYYGGYEVAGGMWYNANVLLKQKMAMHDPADGMSVTLACEEFGLKGCMVSSSPLVPSFNGGWKPFPQHELKVFEKGVMVK